MAGRRWCGSSPRPTRSAGRRSRCGSSPCRSSPGRLRQRRVGPRADRSGQAGHAPIGIGLAAVSLLVMPVLSYAQRRAGREYGSASAVADSKQTLLCTYLSAVLLVGLLANAMLGWWWADPVAALVIAPRWRSRKAGRRGGATPAAPPPRRCVPSRPGWYRMTAAPTAAAPTGGRSDAVARPWAVSVRPDPGVRGARRRAVAPHRRRRATLRRRPDRFGRLVSPNSEK